MKAALEISFPLRVSPAHSVELSAFAAMCVKDGGLYKPPWAAARPRLARTSNLDGVMASEQRRFGAACSDAMVAWRPAAAVLASRRVESVARGRSGQLRREPFKNALGCSPGAESVLSMFYTGRLGVPGQRVGVVVTPS